MTPPWRLSQSQLEDRFFRTWPEILTPPVQWIDHGWDFHVAVVGGQWVVRVARSHAGAWRLQREAVLLSSLEGPPTAIPQYRHAISGMAVYPLIPGKPVSAVHASTWDIRRDLAAFIEWLHQQSQPAPRVDVRTRWTRRVEAVYRRVQGQALDLFSIKEARRIERRFERVVALLAHGTWEPALLHGDLGAAHVLASQDRLAGVLDFGDWQWGDEVYDWCAIPGLQEVMPDRIREDSEAVERLQFYRLAGPFHGIFRGLSLGQVEAVELEVRRIRRLLAEQ